MISESDARLKVAWTIGHRPRDSAEINLGVRRFINAWPFLASGRCRAANPMRDVPRAVPGLNSLIMSQTTFSRADDLNVEGAAR